MKRRSMLFCSILSAVLLSPLAQAKHWHDDDDHWNKHAREHDDHDRDHDRDGCYFRPQDARLITEYYAPRYRELPPGLRKKYYRTGHLPPGWEKRIEPVPVVVERQLPPLPPDYRRGFIDGNVVVYSPRTGIMVDVVAVFGR
jgi:Ni/Co efflux regulator RcnB